MLRKAFGVGFSAIRNSSTAAAKDAAFGWGSTSAVGLRVAFKGRLEKARNEAMNGGGSARIEKQHEKGKLTARERLTLLLDEGSFREYDMLKTHRCDDFGMENEKYYGDGVVTGHGKIHGRKVMILEH